MRGLDDQRAGIVIFDQALFIAGADIVGPVLPVEPALIGKRAGIEQAPMTPAPMIMASYFSLIGGFSLTVICGVTLDYFTGFRVVASIN